jgi:hypothetical protein
MRLVTSTLCLALAFTACSKASNEEETQTPEQSAESTLAEAKLDVPEYLVMKVDENGVSSLAKTQEDLNAAATDEQMGASEEALFNNGKAEVVALSKDDSDVESSTESYHFDDDDLDCFRVKMKLTIRDGDGDKIAKIKKRYKVCENVGPTFRFNRHRVYYRPISAFYVNGCRYVRFAPSSLRFWNGVNFYNRNFRSFDRDLCDRDFCDRDFNDRCDRNVCDRDICDRDICDRDICDRDICDRDFCDRDFNDRDICDRDRDICDRDRDICDRNICDDRRICR